MKLQLLELGEDGERFLQPRRIWRLSWFLSFRFRRGTLRDDSLFLRLCLLSRLRSRRAGFWSMLVLVMLLLRDFLRVRDVAWISHQLIDDSQSRVGRISEDVEAAVSAAKPVAGIADPGGLLNRSQVSTTACHALAQGAVVPRLRDFLIIPSQGNRVSARRSPLSW